MDNRNHTIIEPAQDKPAEKLSPVELLRQAFEAVHADHFTVPSIYTRRMVGNKLMRAMRYLCLREEES